jgi:hypothetical protein
MSQDADHSGCLFKARIVWDGSNAGMTGLRPRSERELC